MEYDNDNCARKFLPDLTTGVNFLFHTKRNPRNNFLIGFNVNIGFVPRYTGYYSITPPFTQEQKDCDIRIGSTHFGFNFGYEFMGFKKPLHRTKAYRKEQTFETFDFSKPVHSFGFAFSNGLSIPPRPKGEGQNIVGALTHYVPEISIQYNCAINKGWGIGIDIPFGLMLRTLNVTPPIAPPDTVWANGTKGNGLATPLYYRFFYTGLAIKSSYTMPIHRNVFMQPQIGIKFLPFIQQDVEFDVGEAAIYDYDTPEEHLSDLIYATVKTEMKKSYNFVPDLMMSLNFLVHGKNLAHNFIFGIHAQICFVDRIKIDYQTTNILPIHSQSKGKVGLRSTSIGVNFGYQFMKGKIVEYSK